MQNTESFWLSTCPACTEDSKASPGTSTVCVLNQIYELVSRGLKCPGTFPQRPESPSTACFVLKFLWQTSPLATKTNLAIIHSTFSSLLPAPVHRHPQNNSEELKGHRSKFFIYKDENEAFGSISLKLTVKWACGWLLLF